MRHLDAAQEAVHRDFGPREDYQQVAVVAAKATRSASVEEFDAWAQALALNMRNVIAELGKETAEGQEEALAILNLLITSLEGKRTS